MQAKARAEAKALARTKAKAKAKPTPILATARPAPAGPVGPWSPAPPAPPAQAPSASVLVDRIAEPGALAAPSPSFDSSAGTADPVAAAPVPTTATPVPTTAAPDATSPQQTLAAVEGVTLHVSPSGVADGNGSVAHPFAGLSQALAAATGGERIVVAPGRYPAATDQRTRTATVTVTGPGDGSAVVEGLTIEGGQQLDISGLTLAGGVLVRDIYARDTGRRYAKGITFRQVEFTGPGATCLRPRNGSSDVVVRDSVFHDCYMGIGAAAGGGIEQSRRLTIENNRFVGFSGDALQIGQWSDVVIRGNVIDEIRDPAGSFHNDGIQFTGNVFRAVISYNRITDSRTQLIFIQDAVGPIDDVLVTNNLLYGAGAVAMQVRGATNARILHNTIWGAKDGGLWLAAGVTTSTKPPLSATDTVVVNNVTQNFLTLDGTRAARAGGNVTRCRDAKEPKVDVSRGTTCLLDPGFVDLTTQDLRLAVASPAREPGIVEPSVLDDLDHVVRGAKPVPGAFG